MGGCLDVREYGEKAQKGRCPKRRNLRSGGSGKEGGGSGEGAGPGEGL